MSEVDVAIETVYRQSDQDDNDDDSDCGIDRRSIPESKKERALQIQRVLLTEQQWFQSLEVTKIFVKVFCKRFFNNN